MLRQSSTRTRHTQTPCTSLTDITASQPTREGAGPILGAAKRKAEEPLNSSLRGILRDAPKVEVAVASVDTNLVRGDAQGRLDLEALQHCAGPRRLWSQAGAVEDVQPLVGAILGSVGHTQEDEIEGGVGPGAHTPGRTAPTQPRACPLAEVLAFRGQDCRPVVVAVSDEEIAGRPMHRDRVWRSKLGVTNAVRRSLGIARNPEQRVWVAQGERSVQRHHAVVDASIAVGHICDSPVLREVAIGHATVLKRLHPSALASVAADIEQLAKPVKDEDRARGDVVDPHPVAHEVEAVATPRAVRPTITDRVGTPRAQQRAGAIEYEDGLRVDGATL
mmetsp:Transcript_75084/g.225700  ORF Transcript_75084/g.225700 Transcript_75084/m.225700 type:complete len:333 (+) Transcript_75084:135-1133(+)